MKPMKLEDFIPEESHFTLKYTGETYTLRMVSLADEAWFLKTFGLEEFNRIFTEMDMEQICRVAFHLLVAEDKEKFIKQEVKFVDESGEYIEMELGGYKLLYSLICGPNEAIAVLNAILKSRGVKFELEAEIEKEETKKKAVKSTGQKSSTHSLMNTAGRSKK